MKFFIDEAGGFQVPTDGSHRVAVSMAMTVSDAHWPRLLDSYQAFVARLSSAEMACGEPKGRLLTPEHLSDFAALLATHDGVSLTPVTMDLGHLSDVSGAPLVEPMYGRLDVTAASMIYATARREMELLARQVRNLSQEQVLRILAWSRSLYEAICHALIFLSHAEHAESWRDVRIEIDPVQRRPGNREQQVVSVMLFAWMMAWTRDEPFPIPPWIDPDQHPFSINFRVEEGIDLSRLIRSNLEWVESDRSPGVQMADIAATIVYRAASDLHDEEGALARFGSLMNASFYGPARASGLISPLPATAPAVADRYRPLVEALARRRRNSE